LFFVFEGPDGSGKSSILKEVKKELEKKVPKLNIIVTKEPGATKLGNKIRKILLKDDLEINNSTNLLLFMADRSSHYQKILKPNLEKDNTIILCDRYWESTLVYQFLNSTQKEKFQLMKQMESLHKMATNYLLPNMTFLITSQTSHRIQDEDNFDKKGAEFREKIRILYDSLETHPLVNYPIKRIDTTNQNWGNYTKKITNTILEKL